MGREGLWKRCMRWDEEKFEEWYLEDGGLDEFRVCEEGVVTIYEVCKDGER